MASWRRPPVAGQCRGWRCLVGERPIRLLATRRSPTGLRRP